MDQLKEIDSRSVVWKSIKKEGLDIEYSVPINRTISTYIFKELENTVEYFTGDFAKVKVFGKEYPLPRQQVAYGDPGISYTFSGVTIPTLPWPEPVLSLREFLYSLKGIKYDFVLVNKYKNGHDHIGEHRDNEKELDPNYPIAAISFGAERTFILRHKDTRKSGKDKKLIAPVKIELEHGSVLFMNPPTNDIWYHSVPARKKILGARISLTFRKLRNELKSE